MRVSTDNDNAFHIHNAQIEDVTEFCYLGSISTDGGALTDVANRLARLLLLLVP